MTRDIPLVSSSQSFARTQPRVLGGCWVVYGFLRLAITVWLVAFTTTATLMFGSLLSRVPDPYSLMSAFHLLYLCATIWSAVAGVLGVVAGVTLLTGQRSGRPLAIAAALLSLPALPFGIALGVYTLVVVLPATAVSTQVASATRT